MVNFSNWILRLSLCVTIDRSAFFKVVDRAISGYTNFLRTYCDQFNMRAGTSMVLKKLLAWFSRTNFISKTSWESAIIYERYRLLSHWFVVGIGNSNIDTFLVYDERQLRIGKADQTLQLNWINANNIYSIPFVKIFVFANVIKRLTIRFFRMKYVHFFVILFAVWLQLSGSMIIENKCSGHRLQYSLT